jgi:uncharacterized protein YcbX
MDTLLVEGRPQAGRVESVFVYPVKGCAGCRLERPHPFDQAGLRHDRCWRVLSVERNEALTQRELPALALVRVALVRDEASRREDKVVAIELSSRATADTVRVPAGGLAGDCGDEVADWLSDRLMIEVRLERRPASFDKAPLTAVFRESLEALVGGVDVNKTAGEGGAAFFSSDVDQAALRFRPNLVLSGLGAWPELGKVAALAVGGVLMPATPNAWAGGCARVPLVDPETGLVHPDEPLAALRTAQGVGEPVLGLRLAVPPRASAGAAVVHGWVGAGHMVVAEPSAAVVERSAVARAAQRDAEQRAEQSRADAIDHAIGKRALAAEVERLEAAAQLELARRRAEVLVPSALAFVAVAHDAVELCWQVEPAEPARRAGHDPAAAVDVFALDFEVEYGRRLGKPGEWWPAQATQFAVALPVHDMAGKGKGEGGDRHRWKARAAGLMAYSAYVFRVRCAVRQSLPGSPRDRRPGAGASELAWGPWSAASASVTTRFSSGDRQTSAWAAGMEWQSWADGGAAGRKARRLPSLLAAVLVNRRPC